MQCWERVAAAVAAGVVIIVSPASARAASVNPEAPKAELAEAVAKQKIGKIEKLLTSGADIDTPYQDGRTALFYAASQGNEALVSRLLAVNAKVDARDASGATPLMAALRNPATRWPTAKLLLDKGADINVADKHGRTPLMEAVLRAPGMMDTDAQSAVVEALLAAGADPAKIDETCTTPPPLANPAKCWRCCWPRRQIPRRSPRPAPTC
jgi:ankyrin repeat protein